jgi:hypothetical protein
MSISFFEKFTHSLKKAFNSDEYSKNSTILDSIRTEIYPTSNIDQLPLANSDVFSLRYFIISILSNYLLLLIIGIVAHNIGGINFSENIKINWIDIVFYCVAAVQFSFCFTTVIFDVIDNSNDGLGSTIYLFAFLIFYVFLYKLNIVHFNPPLFYKVVLLPFMISIIVISLNLIVFVFVLINNRLHNKNISVSFNSSLFLFKVIGKVWKYLSLSIVAAPVAITLGFAGTALGVSILGLIIPSVMSVILSIFIGIIIISLLLGSLIGPFLIVVEKISIPSIIYLFFFAPVIFFSIYFIPPVKASNWIFSLAIPFFIITSLFYILLKIWINQKLSNTFLSIFYWGSYLITFTISIILGIAVE